MTLQKDNMRAVTAPHPGPLVVTEFHRRNVASSGKEIETGHWLDALSEGLTGPLNRGLSTRADFCLCGDQRSSVRYQKCRDDRLTALR